jgi:hypothetical protein
MIAGSSLIVLSLILLNIWSIKVANRLGADFAQLQLDLTVKGCRYCGEPKSTKYLCTECDSILWYRINKRIDKVAFFLAHHRWKVSVGILTFLLIGPLSFSYGVILKRSSEIEKLDGKASEMLEALTEARAKVFEIEHLEMDTSANVQPLLDDLFDAFYHFSWHSGQVVSYLNQTKCNSGKDSCQIADCDPKVERKASISNDSFPCFDALGCACRLIQEKDFVSDLDILFFNYINARSAWKNPNGLDIDSLRCKKVKAASDFYLFGSWAGCIISELSFNLSFDRKNAVAKKYSCNTRIKQAKENWNSIPFFEQFDSRCMESK